MLFFFFSFFFCITDVIGVCKSVDELTRLTTKANREVSKRALSLMDMSGKLVTVTLWGEEVSKSTQGRGVFVEVFLSGRVSSRNPTQCHKKYQIRREKKRFGLKLLIGLIVIKRLIVIWRTQT